MTRRLRLAYFSPLPPSRSGIADYTADLLPHLARLVDITLFVDNVPGVAPEFAADCRLRPFEELPQRRLAYDLLLYHMGNSTHHNRLYETMSRYPGVVVLHDYFLHHFIAHRTSGQGDFGGYARELGYALADEGLELAGQIKLGHKAPPLFDLPLNDRVLDLNLGVIVHSQTVADWIRSRRPQLPLATVPMPVVPHAGTPRRQELGLSAEHVVYASLGQITASKQIPLALRAFRRLRRQWPAARYLLVGAVHPEIDLPATIESLELTEWVHHIEYAPTLQDFVDWLHTADVVVNLRHPTSGETSATAMRALAAGRPLIVFDHAWYAELPSAVARRVPPLAEDALLAAMSELAADSARRQAMGQAGAAYVSQHCAPALVAEQYVAFLQRVLHDIARRYA